MATVESYTGPSGVSAEGSYEVARTPYELSSSLGGRSALIPSRSRSTELESGGGVDLLREYLDDIGEHQLLTKEEEVELAQQIEAGREAAGKLAAANGSLRTRERVALTRQVREGDEATAHFVNSNLRLVVSIAKRYAKAHDEPLLDTIQNGNLGLIHAVEKFDWRKGFKFSTYASWWIRQSINREFELTGRDIRIPPGASNQLRQFIHREDEVRAETGEENVSDETMIQVHGYSGEQVREFRRLQHLIPMHFDATLGESQDVTLWDVTEDKTAQGGFQEAEDRVAKTPLTEGLDRILSDPVQRDIIRARFGFASDDPMTLDGTAQFINGKYPKLNFSKEQVRRNEEIAMLKMRHPAAYQIVLAVMHRVVEREQWKEEANCDERDIKDIVAPTPRGEVISTNDPRARHCGNCAVKEVCLDYGKMIRADRGVWGGAVFTSRRRPAGEVKRGRPRAT